jgi:hypothetical protein
MLNIYDLYCVSTVQSPRIFAIRKFSIVLVTAVSRQNAHCEITDIRLDNTVATVKISKGLVISH